jgi:hypothetical protein
MVRRFGGTSLKGHPLKRKIPRSFPTLLVFRLLVRLALAQTGAHAAGQQSSSSWAKVSSQIDIKSATKDESQTLVGVWDATRGNDHRPSGHTRPRTNW